MEWVAVTGLVILCGGLALKLWSLWDVKNRCEAAETSNQALRMHVRQLKNILERKDNELREKRYLVKKLAGLVPGGSVMLVNSLLQERCNQGGELPEDSEATPKAGDSH